MQANHIDRMILGAIFPGQGSLIAVGNRVAATLRRFCVDAVRGLFLGQAGWRALNSKCTSTVTAPAWASCPTHLSATRRQRHERWMSGVVVEPGTVGVY